MPRSPSWIPEVTRGRSGGDGRKNTGTRRFGLLLSRELMSDAGQTHLQLAQVGPPRRVQEALAVSLCKEAQV